MNSRVNVQSQQPLGVLLMFSGTRNPVGQLQAETFVSGLKRRLGRSIIVIAAYLESQKPNLQMAIRLMNESGVHHWLCIPMQFLLRKMFVLPTASRHPSIYYRKAPDWNCIG